MLQRQEAERNLVTLNPLSCGFFVSAVYRHDLHSAPPFTKIEVKTVFKFSELLAGGV